MTPEQRQFLTNHGFSRKGLADVDFILDRVPTAKHGAFLTWLTTPPHSGNRCSPSKPGFPVRSRRSRACSRTEVTMRGSLKQRYKGSWSLILEMDRERDPKTGLVIRKRKWITFRGTRRQAEKKLNDLVRDAQHGEFVEPSKITLKEWLPKWLELNKARYASSTY